MKVTICMGAKCTMMGANSILDAMESIQEDFCGAEYACDKLEIEIKNCLDYCKKTEVDVAPVVIIDDEVILRATAQEISEKVLDGIKK